MRQRLLAHFMAALAILFGVGSLALFVAFPLGSRPVPIAMSKAGALWWDTLLSLLFFTQHSGMIRRRFREFVSGPVPAPYQRAIYSVASGIALSALVLLWQPAEGYLWRLQGLFRWAAHALALVAVSLFVWGAVALREVDMFGVAAVRAHLRKSAEPQAGFSVHGPYRWVRHPWYLGAVLLFWSSPDVTPDRLLFSILWTVWICIGTRLEERDLLREFGASYAAYRQQVPMLIPRFRWRAGSRAVPATAVHRA
jgi:protein-S-isoprenylcysteine O-methyltransferase Ste14